MDALIKSLRPGKPSEAKPSDVKSPDVVPETRPAELDPAEFLAAAVRADLPRPSRAEAEAAVHTLLSYIGENPDREGLMDTPRWSRPSTNSTKATTSARPKCWTAPSAKPPATTISY